MRIAHITQIFTLFFKWLGNICSFINPRSDQLRWGLCAASERSVGPPSGGAWPHPPWELYSPHDEAGKAPGNYLAADAGAGSPARSTADPEEKVTAAARLGDRWAQPEATPVLRGAGLLPAQLAVRRTREGPALCTGLAARVEQLRTRALGAHLPQGGLGHLTLTLPQFPGL